MVLCWRVAFACIRALFNQTCFKGNKQVRDKGGIDEDNERLPKRLRTQSPEPEVVRTSLRFCLCYADASLLFGRIRRRLYRRQPTCPKEHSKNNLILQRRQVHPSRLI
jgi:hypothetical protein